MHNLCLYIYTNNYKELRIVYFNGKYLRALLFFVCLAGLLFSIACSRGAPETTEVIKEVPVEVIVEKEVIKEVPVEADPGSLVVYSGRSESLVGPIIDQFKISSGIDVSVKYGKTAEIAALILEEGEKSPADVFFAQDPGGLGEVVGMMDAIPAALLELSPEWARSPEGKWIGISGRARVVAYNSASVNPEDLPDSIKGFTDPKWKGRIGWPPTNGSFQAMVTAMRVVWGDDETKKWIEGILANEPKVYPKNTPILAALDNGEVDVGFVNHYYLYRFLAEEGDSFGARNHHLEAGGPGSLVMVAGAGILDTATNKSNAEKFLKFMLSPVAQQYFAGQTFEYPLVDGVKTERLLTPITDIVKPSVDMADLADLSGTQELLRDLNVIP